ncbi:hypothetical protein COP2_035477 [Malus domestica]
MLQQSNLNGKQVQGSSFFSLLRHKCLGYVWIYGKVRNVFRIGECLGQGKENVFVFLKCGIYGCMDGMDLMAWKMEVYGDVFVWMKWNGAHGKGLVFVNEALF